MMRRVAWLIGGGAWGAATFFVGLATTFPEDVARERIAWEVGERTKNEYAVTIGDLSIWRMALDDVQLYTVKKGRKTKDQPKPPMERTPLLHLDSLGLSIPPLKALAGKEAVAFDARLYEGAIDGTWSRDATETTLVFDAEDVDLAKLDLGGDTNTFNLLGKLEGEGDLTLNTEDVKESSGTLKLSFPGLGLGAGSAVGGFQLPEVVFTKADLAFEVREGKLEVTEGTFESPTLSATVSGDITLNKKLARSRYRLEIAFTLPEDLDQLAQLAGDLKRARDAEGQYHYLVTGTIFQPHARPTRTSASKAGTKDAAPGAPRDRLVDGPFAGERDFDPEASDEERRKAREERIRERRERLRKRREERAAKEGDRNAEGPVDRLDREPLDREFEDGPDRDLPPPPLDEDEDQPQPGDFPYIPDPGDEGPPPPEEE